MKIPVCAVSLAVLAFAAHSLSAQQVADINVSANISANCTITAAPLVFGAYDPVTGPQVDRSAAITLTCTQGSTARVKLDNGANYTGSRRMAGGTPAGFLNYELYRGSAGGTPWGSEEVTVTTFDANNNATLTVYGRIPSGQKAAAVGIYSDIVKATVNF